MKKYEICLRYALSNTYLDKVVVGLDNHEQLRKLITIANKGYLKLNVKNLSLIMKLILSIHPNGQA